MQIEIACPQCGKRLKGGPEVLGRRVRCPVCKMVFEARNPEAEDRMAPSDASADALPNSASPLGGETVGSSADEFALAALESAPASTPPGPSWSAANSSVDSTDSDEFSIAAEPSRPPASPARPIGPSRPASSAPAVKSRKKKTSSVQRPAIVVRHASRQRHWLFALALAPLVYSLLTHSDEPPPTAEPEITQSADDGQGPAAAETASESSVPTPWTAGGADDFGPDGSAATMDIESLFELLPDHRLNGAHLSRFSYVHWLYALLSVGLFLAAIEFVFDRGEAEFWRLVVIGLTTATVGVFMLLCFQLLANWSQGFWVRGRSIVVLLFYLVKLIGFSYRAALDPENGFLLSFFGFTVGVGLCEELVKAVPVMIRMRGADAVSWRAACVCGLASGVGFGVAEGIMYSSDYYNGFAPFSIYLVRFISCVALHAVWSASAALMIWHNQADVGPDLDWSDLCLGMLKVLGVPIVLHGLYDTLLKRELYLLALVSAAASFVWMTWMIHRSWETDPEPASPVILGRQLA